MNAHRLFVLIPVIIVAALTLTACPAPPATPSIGNSTPLPVCPHENFVDFADLTPGTTYKVGDVFLDSGTNIVVQQFQLPDKKSWTKDGEAVVHDQSYMQGSTKPYLWTNNVSLRFLFNMPLKGLSFRFAYWGGNTNITINNDFQNLGDISALQGQKIGGVDISVQIDPAISSSTEGVITLTGPIDSISVGGGGQEFAIDDVCPM